MAFSRNELGESSFTSADIFSAFSRKPSFTDLVFAEASTKVSLHNAKTGLEVSISGVRVSLGGLRASLGQVNEAKASKVSLFSAKSALEQLIDLRATQVSLGNVQSQITELVGGAPEALDTIHELAGQVSLYATKVSLSAQSEFMTSLFSTKASLGLSEQALEGLINLRATQVSLGTAVVSIGSLNTRLTSLEDNNGGVSLGSITSRLDILEAGGTQHDGTPAETVDVNWTNLSEINLSGEKIINGSFDPPVIALGVDVEVIVQWTNGGKTASVGEIYTVDLVQSNGGMRLAGNGQSLFISATQLSINVVALHPWALTPSYNLPTPTQTPPPNGWAYEEFAVDIEVKWIGSSTGNHTQGNIYQANAFRPAWTNYSGNIRIKNDSDNYGWVGNNRGTDWEVVTRLPAGWDFNSFSPGTLNESELINGVITGVGGAVSIEQTFPTPLAVGTKIVVKATREDTQSGSNVKFQHIKVNGNAEGTNIDIPFADGYAEYEVVNNSMAGIRIGTNHGNNKVSEISVFQGAMSGGTVEATANTLAKISGANAWNAGASSSQSIPAGHDGYFQFQYGGTGSVKIGLTYEDDSFDHIIEPSKFSLQIGNNGGITTSGYNSGTGFAPPGTRIRIRHYSADNQIQFQRKQTIYSQLPNFALPSTPNSGHATNFNFSALERPLVIALQTVNGMTLGGAYRMHQYNTSNGNADIYDFDGTRLQWIGERGAKWEVAEEAGEDYVTFHTPDELTTNAPLFLDTSLFHAGSSQINDMVAFIGTPSASTPTTNITQENSADILQLQADLAAALARIQTLESHEHEEAEEAEPGFKITIIDTKSNILARTGDAVGTIAFATDTKDIYVYNTTGFDKWSSYEDDIPSYTCTTTSVVSQLQYATGDEAPLFDSNNVAQWGTVVGSAFDGVLTGTAGTDGWYAYDQAYAQIHGFNQGYKTSGVVGQSFPTPQVVTQYRMYPWPYADRSVDARNWVFEASNDNFTTAVTLDTQTNQQFTLNTWRDYNIVNTTAYSQYRLRVTLNNGSSGYLVVQEIELLGCDVSNATL